MSNVDEHNTLVGWTFQAEFFGVPTGNGSIGDYGDRLMERMLDEEAAHPHLTDSGTGTGDPDGGPNELYITVTVRNNRLDLACSEVNDLLYRIGAETEPYAGNMHLASRFMRSMLVEPWHEPAHTRAEAVMNAIYWLFNWEQPDGAVIQHHGLTASFTTEHGVRTIRAVPRGWSNKPVIVIETRTGDCLKPGEMESLAQQLTYQGHRPIHKWNGDGFTSGSFAIEGAIEPTLLAAVDRYYAGCPTHRSVFCGGDDCDWYRTGRALIRAPHGLYG